MRSPLPRRLGVLGAVAIVATALAVPASAGAGPSPAVAGPGQVDLTFLNINDFHGRVDANTVKFAGTVEQLRAAAGDANTLLLSAGDNIGASLFDSATQQDQPTIDILNALGLAASAVGNHEFDMGFADLRDRVINGGANATFTYLGANVYDTATGNPVLPEYDTFVVGGQTVGVIGVVTSETPTLVSPGGIAGLTFGDPVAAVNRVAAQLSDGNTVNGEADILVAEFHDGAGAGIPEGSTLAQEVAQGGQFAAIVNDTSALVDVIFTGHTHKAYAWDAPVPGQPGVTRPIVQTGSYGERIGKVVLTVDQTTHQVVAYTAENVARTTVADATLVATYPRVAAVKTINDAALAYGKVVGSVPVGQLTADVTTAFTGGSYVNGVYTGGGRDDRASESTMGDLVADSLVTTLSAPEFGGATIGVVNPGGLRNEFYYAPDGVITYAEANAVLPFANSLFTITLTGAQFKMVLEQQWQRLPNGTVPSRPYLQLGLSHNVTYTFDATLPEGSRITSITIDGQPYDPNAQYRIGAFSFLIEGGDNFHAFKLGTNRKDSGLIDRDAWVQFLTDNSPISPDFARQSASVSPTPTVASIGKPLADLTVSKLDLTSLGSPQNTSLAVSIGGTSLGSVAVAGGSALVTGLVVPPGTPTGSQQLTMVASPSGTTITMPIQVIDERVKSTTTITSSRTWQRFGGPQTAKLSIKVALDGGAAATGSVDLLQDGAVIATLPLVNGTASYTLPAGTPAGQHQYTARYADTNTIAGSSASVGVRVDKASSATILLTDRLLVVKGRSNAKLTAFVLLNSPAIPTGTVTFTVDGVAAGTVSVVNGKATLTVGSDLGLGVHVVRAVYSGDVSIQGSVSNPALLVVVRR